MSPYLHQHPFYPPPSHSQPSWPSQPPRAPWYAADSPTIPTPVSTSTWPSQPPCGPWYAQDSPTIQASRSTWPSQPPCAPHSYNAQESPSVQGPVMSTSTQQSRSSTTPKPNSILKVCNPLPSSAIQKEKLKPPSEVISSFPKLRGENKAGTLAVKLARLAFFGDEVLVQCTPGGGRGVPGLPIAELNLLKEAMFGQFSQYWGNPSEFEGVWNNCFNAIGQACKRLRNPH